MPIIEVKGLSKRYNGLVAVDNINFSVGQGERFAFLGPNGAGKSTTIKMLTTLLRPTSGSIRMAGADPVAQPKLVRRAFGIVFQDPSLDDELTAHENLSFHAGLYDVPQAAQRIDALLRMVELYERKDDLVKKFSGGMKRRLEIARGLLHHPKILFLDEPTLGLDPQTRAHIWKHILQLNREKGVTIFFTTHYLEEAMQVAQRIAVMDHGRIVAQGTAKELMQRTRTKNLEAAFIKLTGKGIREEEASGIDQMRLRRKVFHR